MTELQHTDTTHDLYERLINRLGLALETADIAVRLRDEWPEELELRGLSRAEFDLIEAYLNNAGVAAGGDVSPDVPGSFIVSREPAEAASVPSSSAKVIWLKDKKRAMSLAKLNRHNSSNLFRR
ncbi:hypothetical protein ALP94_02664 [Pseudomonas savastanoi pv. glycinea]|nr:hypothetical protein [Pseudomonas syringae]MCQ3031053.1 hypothetical protein [Pseudomonas syringae]MDG6402672.1 hypothetical protein [Pseudomonas quasicaspiana]RMQ96074.1 hypothetical protein ALP94_02664 [Pseudomonas savastanoi pv. glycinea]